MLLEEPQRFEDADRTTSEIFDTNEMNKGQNDDKDKWIEAVDDLYATITDWAIFSADGVRTRWNEVSSAQEGLDASTTHAVMFEFYYYYYSVADRLLFAAGGDNRRSGFLDLALDFGVRPLIESMLPEAKDEVISRFALERMEDFNRAIFRYGECPIPYSDPKRTLADVRFWELLESRGEGNGTRDPIAREFASSSWLVINIQSVVGAEVSLGKLVGLVLVTLQQRLDSQLLDEKVNRVSQLNPP